MKHHRWQAQLATAINDIDTLCQRLSLNKKDLPWIDDHPQPFPLRVPEAFVSRMAIGDPNDPLLRQVLPSQQEHQSPPHFSTDPLHEQQASPAPGILHKYTGRVLLTLTGACAVHCRYCFRRHYPYEEAVPGLSAWQPAFDYLHQHTDVHEVILSGGDPLMIKDPLLDRFIQDLAAIPHIQRLRIHTRLPIVIPDRMTDKLIKCLAASRLQVVMVVHANHPRELDHTVKAAFANCHGHMTLLNQAVLLRGVNDDASTLISLSEALFECGILPYYLHRLDPVAGAAHFDVPRNEAQTLLKAIQHKLPGYLVPRLAEEHPGEASKTWLSSNIPTST